MADIKQITVAGTTYNIEPYTNYLPLTGGTLENTFTSTPLILKGNGTESTGAFLGFQWGSHTTPTHFIGVDGGAPYFLAGSSEYLLLHNGNLKIDGVKPATTGTVINRYGKCSTAATTPAKSVSITTGVFNLEAGARVTVQFTNKNTANNPTLNVNGKGAKNIFHNGARITTGTNKGMLYGIVDFIYDGTQWHLIGNYVDTNTYGGTGNTTSKIFLMGGTSQSSSNKTTYSNVGCYASGGYLYSNSTKVSVEGHTHSYLPLSGGTITGSLTVNEKLYGPQVGSNPRNQYDSGLYFFNCDPNSTSNYNFGLYQWVDKFQFTTRTASNNTYKTTAFEIDGDTGTTSFSVAPTVNGSRVMTAADFNFTNGILMITT